MDGCRRGEPQVSAAPSPVALKLYSNELRSANRMDRTGHGRCRSSSRVNHTNWIAGYKCADILDNLTVAQTIIIFSDVAEMRRNLRAIE